MKIASNRRQFLFTASAAGIAVLALHPITAKNADAAELAPVDPSGPQAMALGYVEDATQADTEKFERYEAGQLCSNCQLYQGTADSAVAGCLLFAGKSVTAGGWCNSWVKKAG